MLASKSPTAGAIDQRTRFAEGDIRSIESRFSPDNREANLALVTLLKDWAVKKEATPAQIALAWLMAKKPWIVPIPGTTKLHRLEENIGASDIALSADDLHNIAEAAAEIEVHGARLPEAVLKHSYR